MQKNIFYTCLVSLLLSVAVGCAVKPYSKVIEIPLTQDNFNINWLKGQICHETIVTPDNNILLLNNVKIKYVIDKGSEVHITKINLKGEILWHKAIEGILSDFKKIMITANKHILIIGKQQVSKNEEYYEYPFLLEIDLDGNIIQSIIFENLEYIKDIAETSNGDFIILGMRMIPNIRYAPEIDVIFRINHNREIIWEAENLLHKVTDFDHIERISDTSYLINTTHIIPWGATNKHYGTLKIINESGKILKSATIHEKNNRVLNILRFNNVNIVIINQYIYAFNDDLKILWRKLYNTNIPIQEIFIKNDLLHIVYTYHLNEKWNKTEYHFLEIYNTKGELQKKQQYKRVTKDFYNTYLPIYKEFISIKNNIYTIGACITDTNTHSAYIFFNQLNKKESCIWSISNDTLNVRSEEERDYQIIVEKLQDMSLIIRDDFKINILPNTLKIKTFADFKTKIYNTCDIDKFIYKPITR